MNEWTDEKLAELPVRDHVRQRGLAATRLEAFCDAAFAFSVTILVISTGGVPGSYAELMAALRRDVPAFAASFTAIAAFWAAHRMWSQRYGLEDRTSTFLSLAMVFVMLIYVYPLKMVFGAGPWVSGGALPAKFSIASRGMVGLFVIYGLGFAAQSAMLGR